MRTYRDLLATPSVARLLATSLVGRLPNGMTALALVLAVSGGSGSYGAAGAVSAAYLVGTGVSAPVAGRAMDRHGRRRVLVPLALLNAALLAAVALATGAGMPLLMSLAAAAGATQPPLGAALRSLWGELLDRRRRDSVFALESTVQELVFIVGPTLVAALAALAGPRAALAAVGLIGLSGVLAFVGDPAVRTAAPSSSPEGTRPTTRLGVLAAPPLRRLLVAGVTMVAALSAVDLAVIATMGGAEEAGKAGLALALWSASSLVGGIAYGAWTRPQLRLPVLTAAMAVHFASLVLATGPVTLSVLLLLGGVTVAPVIARTCSEVADAVPAASATEAFSWLSTAWIAGGVLGAAGGGWLVDTFDPRAAFVAAAVLALGAVAATVRTPAALVPAERRPTGAKV